MEPIFSKTKAFAEAGNRVLDPVLDCTIHQAIVLTLSPHHWPHTSFSLTHGTYLFKDKSFRRGRQSSSRSSLGLYHPSSYRLNPVSASLASHVLLSDPWNLSFQRQKLSPRQAIEFSIQSWIVPSIKLSS